MNFKGTKIISKIKAKNRLKRETNLISNGATNSGEMDKTARKQSCAAKKSDFIELDTFVVSANSVKPQSSNNNNNTNTNKTNTSEVNLNTSDSMSNLKTSNNQTLITHVTMTTTNATLPKENSPLKSGINSTTNTNSNANSIHLNPNNATESPSCSQSLRRVSINVPNDYVSYTTHHVATERSTQTTMRHHLIAKNNIRRDTLRVGGSPSVTGGGITHSLTSTKGNGCKKIEIFLLASVVVLLVANLHFILFLNINMEEAAAAAAVSGDEAKILFSNHSTSYWVIHKKI